MGRIVKCWKCGHENSTDYLDTFQDDPEEQEYLFCEDCNERLTIGYFTRRR